MVGLMRSKKRKETTPLFSGRIGFLTQTDPSRKKRQMQYTESMVDCLKGLAQDHPGGIDWQSACKQMNDPRRNQGKRYSITSIVLLAPPRDPVQSSLRTGHR
jgi:hypothetical protein